MCNYDPEKPYVDAARREELYQAKVDLAKDNIWGEFTEQYAVEQFISGYEPENLDRDLIHHIAQANEEIQKLKNPPLTQKRLEPDVLKAEIQKVKLKLFDDVFYCLDEHIGNAAECRVQKEMF